MEIKDLKGKKIADGKVSIDDIIGESPFSQGMVFKARARLIDLDIGRFDIGNIIEQEVLAVRSILPQDIGVEVKGISDADEMRKLPENKRRDLLYADPEAQEAVLRRTGKLRERLADGAMTPEKVVNTLGEIAQREVSLAAKVMPRVSGQIETFFYDEMNIVRKLPRHKNIVNAFGGGMDPTHGVNYILMELVDNVHHLSKLGEWVQTIGQPLPYASVMGIMRDIVEGVKHLANNGISHRDLKPANIILARSNAGEGYALPVPRFVQGQGMAIEVVYVIPKIVDLGIAKAIYDAGIQGLSQGRTRTGIALGTPSYMSPEQALAEGLTSRSDLFAVGAVGYYMVSGGQDPFPPDDPGDPTTAVRRVVQENPRPLKEINAEIPILMADFFNMLLVKDYRFRVPIDKASEIADRRYEILRRQESGEEVPDFREKVDILRSKILAAEKDLKTAGSAQDKRNLYERVGSLYAKIAEELPIPTVGQPKPHKFSKAYYLQKAKGAYWVAVKQDHEKTINEAYKLLLDKCGKKELDDLLDTKLTKYKETQEGLAPSDAAKAIQIVRLLSVYFANTSWRKSGQVREAVMKSMGNNQEAYTRLADLLTQYRDLTVNIDSVSCLLYYAKSQNRRLGVEDTGTDTLEQPGTSAIQAAEQEPTGWVTPVDACAETHDVVLKAGLANIEMASGLTDRMREAYRHWNSCPVTDIDQLVGLFMAGKSLVLNALDQASVKRSGQELPGNYAAARTQVSQLEASVKQLKYDVLMRDLTRTVAFSTNEQDVADAAVQAGVLNLEKGRVGEAYLDFKGVPESRSADAAPYLAIVDAVLELSDKSTWSGGFSRADYDAFTTAKDEFILLDVADPGVPDLAESNRSIISHVRELSSKLPDGVKVEELEAAVGEYNTLITAENGERNLDHVRAVKMAERRVYELLADYARAAHAALESAGQTPIGQDLEPSPALVSRLRAAFSAIGKEELAEQYVNLLKSDTPPSDADHYLSELRKQGLEESIAATNILHLGVICMNKGYVAEAKAYLNSIPEKFRGTATAEYALLANLIKFEQSKEGRESAPLKKEDLEQFRETLRAYEVTGDPEVDKSILRPAEDISQKAKLGDAYVRGLDAQITYVSTLIGEGSPAATLSIEKLKVQSHLRTLERNARAVLRKDDAPYHSHCKRISDQYMQLGALEMGTHFRLVSEGKE